MAFPISADGANGNGTADNKAAIEAAIQRAINAGGGTVLIDGGTDFDGAGSVKGIYALATAINKSFGVAGGALIVKGEGGNSTLLFNAVGQYYNGMYLSNSELIKLEDFVAVGLQSRNYDFTNAGLVSVGVRTVVDGLGLYGLGLAASNPESGLLSIISSTFDVRNVNINGCAAPNNAALKLNACPGGAVRNCTFVDLHNINGVGYSKSPLGATAWIWIKDPIETAISTSRDATLIEDCSFDEASAYPVIAENANDVEINRCAANIGAGQGYWFKNVKNAVLRNSKALYSGSPGKKGAIFEDCEDVLIENFTCKDGVDTIEIKGTTKRVRIVNSWYQEDDGDRLPLNIANSAGALIDIDGVKTKGALTQIG
jgi:hypothetical protein